MAPPAVVDAGSSEMRGAPRGREGAGVRRKPGIWRATCVTCVGRVACVVATGIGGDECVGSATSVRIAGRSLTVPPHDTSATVNATKIHALFTTEPIRLGEGDCQTFCRLAEPTLYGAGR